jgi:hypothetical protein
VGRDGYFGKGRFWRAGGRAWGREAAGRGGPVGKATSGVSGEGDGVTGQRRWSSVR